MSQAAEAGEHGHGHGGADHVPHVVPLKNYFAVWAALIVLTGITVGVSYVDFGAMNLVIALVVATIKASLVALIFMHLFYDEKFNSIVLIFGLIFLAIFIAFTRFDTFGRGLTDAIEGGRPGNSTAPFDSNGVPAQDRPAPAKKEGAATGHHGEAAKPAEGAKPAEAAKPAEVPAHH